MRDDLKRLTETDLATLVEDTMEWDDASSTHHVSPSELINEADQSTGWLEGSDDDDYEEDDDTANGPEDDSDIDEDSYYAHAFRI